MLTPRTFGDWWWDWAEAPFQQEGFSSSCQGLERWAWLGFKTKITSARIAGAPCMLQLWNLCCSSANGLVDHCRVVFFVTLGKLIDNCQPFIHSSCLVQWGLHCFWKCSSFRNFRHARLSGQFCQCFGLWSVSTVLWSFLTGMTCCWQMLCFFCFWDNAFSSSSFSSKRRQQQFLNF